MATTLDRPDVQALPEVIRMVGRSPLMLIDGKFRDGREGRTSRLTILRQVERWPR